jgi:hypothetical protein
MACGAVVDVGAPGCGEDGGYVMGRAILLWLLGVPIPVILLLALCSHH